ncbi:MAG: hypothetical protein ACRCZY_04440 [Phocaeicola sp.]
MKFFILILISFLSIKSSLATNQPSDFDYSFVELQSESASLTISNRSDYELTIKIMHLSGSLYTTICIAPNSSGRVSFSNSGIYYVKSKAEKSFSSTLYKKDSPFQIQSNSNGYTVATIEYYISGGGGSAGATISKSEFEKNN